MNLYVDIGNSRIRLVEGDGKDALVSVHDYTSDTLPAIIHTFCQTIPPPARILVSNVAGVVVAGIFSGLCERCWGLRPEYLKVSDESHGIRNGYRDTGQLGVDRWLAMIAAREKYTGSLCVVDCGTAVTIDVIDAGGQHRGGYIIPGRYLMQQSLIINTGGLSVSGHFRATGEAGRSTEECIYNGTVLAVACLIEHIAGATASDGGGHYECIITGGGAEEVMGLLDIDYHHDPMLVIDGIRLAAGFDK